MRNYIRLPVFLVTFDKRNHKQRLKGFNWKSLKIYKECIKKLFFIRLFQNWSLKKYVFKFALLKLLPHKYILKKYILKNTFSKLFSKKYFFKITLLGNTFSKLPSQKKICFQNYSFKKIHFQIYFLKIAFLKNINLLRRIRKITQLSWIWLTTFFSIYLHSFKKTRQ